MSVTSSNPVGGLSTNPFDSPVITQRSVGRSNGGGNTSNNNPSEPLIWAARNVDWPIPNTLSQNLYQKLWHQSQALGQEYGIQSVSAGGTTTGNERSGALGTAGDATTGMDNSVGLAGDQASSYGLSGFMSRLVITGGTDTKEGDSKKSSGGTSKPSSPSTNAVSGVSGSNAAVMSRPLRPPRAHCVAAANGWIVAVLETTKGGLRLISRWNVRRGSLTGSSLSDHWIALPPPILTTAKRRQEGRIKHVLVDPTASHTLVSATNGEAYYLHSSGTQRLIKLPGFGPSSPLYEASSKKKHVSSTTVGGTGSSSAAIGTAGANSAGASAGLHLTGIAATDVAHRRDEQSQASIQAGLSLGSYVTAVAWDKERGTEGSSKRVLLGTSMGEIYEYTFPNPSDEEDAKKTGDKADKSTSSHVNLPILLHKLSAGDGNDSVDSSQLGAAVTGLYFERMRTGLLVICATSGRQKRTRFHSFYSPHNSSFRAVLADQQYASLVELPGSVEFADMVTVGDVFALRTAVGIYYGRVDRSLTNTAAMLAAGGSSMIVDSGILPYDTIHSKQASAPSTSGVGATGNSSNVPVSLALTPHHFIILTESNQLCFINRVAQKIIQKERVDLGQGPSSSVSSSGNLDETSMSIGGLLMDSRRPDQVWLRQGRYLVHISSSQEDRDVWKYTLQKCLDMQVPSKGSFAGGSASASRPRLSQSDYPGGKPLSEEEKAQEALFEQAKALCSNAAQKSVVTAARAEYHLSQGRAELAAKYFALCPSVLAPFPDTAIRLALPNLGINDPKSYGASPRAWASLEATNVPLITYLADKMRVGKMNDDSMTCTMISAWLTELFLHERGERWASAPLVESPNLGIMEDSSLLTQFLISNVNSMDAKTIMKILTSHDVGAHECALYAAKSGDIATAVNAAISVGVALSGPTASSSTLDNISSNGAYEALVILDEAPFELAEPLYYRHASTLLARAPGSAVDGFLARYPEGLSPSRLLPSIMNYEQRRLNRARTRKFEQTKEPVPSYTNVVRMIDDSNEGLEVGIGGRTTTALFVEDANAAIRYLEGVINQGCRISAIFSYLISLYAKLEDEEPLLKFLTVHVSSASAWDDSLPSKDRLGLIDYGQSGPLDMSAALRTVLESGRHYRSAIKLYMGFGMRQQAVELALKVDPSLARELAQESVELEERKRLWLMIAKNAASDNSSRGGKDVVSRVVSVLKDCGPDVLSIEDVLPFLPDFAQIDQIKDEICEALTSYSSRIEGFLREMSDCDQTCDKLRLEITRLKNRQTRVKANARCAITNKLVLKGDEPFYVFPSGYVILASAVKKEVMPFLNEKQRARVQELEKELKAIPESHPNRDKLQAELDGLIAAECPLTGTVMIESIDQGFENSDEIDDLNFGLLDIERAEV